MMRLMECFLIPMITVTFILFLITPALFNGTIIIERNYLDEWKIAEIDLEECKESKIPSCAACECKESSGHWFFYVLGMLIYLGTILFATKKNNELNKREKELIERESKLNKKGKSKCRVGYSE